MAGSNHSPSHAWLIGNNFLRFFGWCFLLLLGLLIIALAWFRVSAHEACQKPLQHDLNTAGYWLHVSAGSTAAECADHDY
jgi:hypothetical protein